MAAGLGKIMLCDDEQSVVEVLAEYFGGQGYTVRTVSSGEEALSVLPEFKPAVLLLDIRMPGLDGVEVLRRVRALDSSVSVIMVTANEDVELARETLKLGAFDYVSKPFDFGYLDEAVTLGIIQSGGGPSAPSGTRGAETAQRSGDVWHGVTLATFRAARDMSSGARDSTGQRMESAALSAAREADGGRSAAAIEALQELETLLAIAAELGDVTSAARDAVQAAIVAARNSVSAR